MFKKLFYRRSLKNLISNLSAGAIQYERVTDLIANLNDLYLACAYGEHFSQKIEAERAMIAALRAEKKLLERDISLLEESLNKED
jgi:hypothetical protein